MTGVDSAAGVLEGVEAVLLRGVYVSLIVLLPRANSECSFMSGVIGMTGESVREGP